jgi:hypothetical protein
MAHIRLKLLFKVIARWSIDLFVIFSTLEVVCTTTDDY